MSLGLTELAQGGGGRLRKEVSLPRTAAGVLCVSVKRLGNGEFQRQADCSVAYSSAFCGEVCLSALGI
jgi:hypothetical protein